MKKFLALFLALVMITAVAPINVFAEELKEITYIEINLDPKIAGKSPADYRDFLTVSGEGVELGSEDYFKTTYIENINGFGYKRDAEVFEEGVNYTSMFCIYPKEGYSLTPNLGEIPVKYYVHGSKGTTERTGIYLECEENDHGTAEHYHILINYTAEAQEP